MDAQPMIQCPVCGAERPDLILAWCMDERCPSGAVTVAEWKEKQRLEKLKTENGNGKAT